MRELTDGSEKSAACAEITATLPEWFGQPEANAMYIRDIAATEVFATERDGAWLGAIALKYHFETTAEIWWMGVTRRHHRLGLGSALMEKALSRAAMRGCLRAVLMTLSPRSSDTGYAATRKFYERHGFAPMVEFNESDPVNPMMWMIRPL